MIWSNNRLGTSFSKLLSDTNVFQSSLEVSKFASPSFLNARTISTMSLISNSTPLNTLSNSSPLASSSKMSKNSDESSTILDIPVIILAKSSDTSKTSWVASVICLGIRSLTSYPNKLKRLSTRVCMFARLASSEMSLDNLSLRSEIIASFVLLKTRANLARKSTAIDLESTESWLEVPLPIMIVV